MTTREQPAPSGIWSPVVVFLGAVAVAVVAVTDALPALEFAFLVTAALVIGLAHRAALAWHVQLTAVVLVILFIPIRRYAIPGNLPIDVEPYRALGGGARGGGGGVALFVDPAVHLRRSGYEAPIAAIVVSVMASVALNPGRVSGVSDEVVKDLSFLLTSSSSSTSSSASCGGAGRSIGS